LEDFVQTLGNLVGWISPGSLLAEARGGEGPAFYILFLTLFSIVFVAGLVAVFGAGRLSKDNRLHRRLLARYGSWGIWLGLVGLMAVGLRFATVPLFSKRLWSVLDALAIVAVAAHYFWYRRREYAGELSTYVEQERRRRFQPPRRGRTGRRRR